MTTSPCLSTIAFSPAELKNFHLNEKATILTDGQSVVIVLNLADIPHPQTNMDSYWVVIDSTIYSVMNKTRPEMCEYINTHYNRYVYISKYI